MINFKAVYTIFLESNKYLNFFLVIGGLLILFVLLTIFINKNKIKLIYSEIEALAIQKKLVYEKSSDKRFDCIIKTKDYKLLIKVVSIPSNSSVTINSKDTWCLRFGGGNRKGRNYPNKQYMNELVPFLKLSENSLNTNNLIVRKIIILHPSTETILKYMNESDICEIKPTDTPYGYKVVTYKDFFTCFDILTK